MMDLWRDNPVLRGAGYALGVVAVIGLFVWLSRPSGPRAAAEAAAASAASPAADEASAPQSRPNERMILAACHPELSPNTPSVPRFDVSQARTPWAISLKVRFWVNGDGFVTKAFALGGNAGNTLDAEAALQYTKSLTFQVPNDDECRTREIEIFGEFKESADAGGEWQTVLEIHPRYAMENGNVVEYTDPSRNIPPRILPRSMPRVIQARP
jgi:hypothetical protein